MWNSWGGMPNSRPSLTMLFLWTIKVLRTSLSTQNGGKNSHVKIFIWHNTSVLTYIPGSRTEWEALITKKSQSSTKALVHMEVMSWHRITQPPASGPLHLEPRWLICNLYSYWMGLPVTTDSVSGWFHTTSPNWNSSQREGIHQFTFFRCYIHFYFVSNMNLFSYAAWHSLGDFKT